MGRRVWWPRVDNAFAITGPFWIRHLGIPLAAAIVILFAAEHSSFDLWLADGWYRLEGGHWAWRSHWLTSDLIHHHGKVLLKAFGLMLIVLLAASTRSRRLNPWRWPAAYLLTCMALLPALIATLKRFSPVPCPWDLARYGGDLPYLHTFDYPLSAATAGHCFPAGHASGGFALIALYFAVLPYVRRPALMLIPGLATGVVFALGQQARGAHFVSHDLWTLSLCWFGALALFVLFRPWRWVPDLQPAGKQT